MFLCVIQIEACVATKHHDAWTVISINQTFFFLFRYSTLHLVTKKLIWNLAAQTASPWQWTRNAYRPLSWYELGTLSRAVLLDHLSISSSRRTRIDYYVRGVGVEKVDHMRHKKTSRASPISVADL
ncbi:hypothetical protein BS50DRAFT_140801 [Corynespora cassiicola Philippines]|uniref:Uncharacterized protein n=1 Tax=Corynespora cassiicola Philippines TaxID=1448308 RepID=A0A2T2N9T0_CORCC|nr:hypothetical protein BS50DRAFT_140801 [Corynespora cassiicola Philippines]